MHVSNLLKYYVHAHTHICSLGKILNFSIFGWQTKQKKSKLICKRRFAKILEYV